jgi:hypothetical protein
MWSRKLNLRRCEEAVAYIGNDISVHLWRNADGDYVLNINAPSSVMLAYEIEPRRVPVAKPGQM